jgi:hypothetical protein
MDLDFQQDAADVYAYLVARAASYTPAGDHGPGGIGPVKMVYAGYEFDQAGWFALVFDRRPNAAHDGEWTVYLEGNMLDRPKWVTAGVRCGSKFGPLLGQMLVGVLQRAERDGVFAQLPRADGFRLGIEEFNGSFGWDSAG